MRHAFMWWLDATLFVAYILLLAPHLTGLEAHEVVGLVLVVPVLVHMLLGWSWIAAAVKRAARPRTRRETVNLLINIAFFVTSVVVIVSGLMISQFMLPYLGVATIDDWAWRRMHNTWTNWLKISMGLHIAMNWRWIATAARKYLPRLTARVGRRAEA